ncbi:hypothetical protein [Maliponia aquimaris]|uniref:Fructose-bisphosphate aldolase n=1 Tax=Maliponia aquimaris TaxID=1673631 RepID=A0A238K4V2_9RHOB|nr:Fructose-bisphosphate aldolase [Maliponia aquimaris]
MAQDPGCHAPHHGNSFAACKTAIDLGFSSVVVNGSLGADGKTPASCGGKFSRTPAGDIPAMETLMEFHRRLPATHPVMHGASAVPPNSRSMPCARAGASRRSDTMSRTASPVSLARAASIGRDRILGIAPVSPYGRVPVILCARNEVGVIEKRHADQ